MKGHLNVKELESLKKADLQKLARDMGVSDAGTVKEIAARCAAVEVEIPDEGELTEEEKEALADEEGEQAAAEQAAAEQAEADAGEKTAAGGTNEEVKPDKNAGKVTVIATTRYLDKQLNQIKDAGEAITVSEERAAELVKAGVAKIKE